MDIYNNVKEYYGKILKSKNNLKTNVCTIINKPRKEILDILNKIPDEIKNKFYGCGSIIPHGIESLNILDLGSGSGQDCYIISKLITEKGYVIGIDMTDEQISLANKYINEYTKKLNYKKPNMEFKKGYIEYLDELDIEKESIDIVISNCVLNLSPNKEKVIKNVYDLLKEGGSFYFSDIYCDRRLDENIKNNKILWGECISGALYEEDFKRICNKVGFIELREVERNIIKIENEELKNITGNANFYSITYNIFKINSLESLCEDYGQYTIYKGSISNMEHNYILDRKHIFIKDKPTLICGNTADILSKSWLSKHFIVYGSKKTHYGLFDSCYNKDNKEDILYSTKCC